MEFDRNKVYTALNADELKIGSKVIIGDTIDALRNRVLNGSVPVTLSEIKSDDYAKRFRVEEYTETDSVFGFAYLIEGKKLKWTDLKIGDIVTNGTRTYMVIGIDSKGKYGSHIFFGNDWITDEDLQDWEKVE